MPLDVEGRLAALPRGAAEPRARHHRRGAIPLLRLPGMGQFYTHLEFWVQIGDKVWDNFSTTMSQNEPVIEVAFDFFRSSVSSPESPINK